MEEGLEDCVVWDKRSPLDKIFAIEQGVTANVILLDLEPFPKLYELLAAGRKIVSIGPRVEDQEALLARYGANFVCIDCAGRGPKESEIRRVA
jgi:hypothetical protein